MASLPLAGSGRIGRGTCARPGLGALSSEWWRRGWSILLSWPGKPTQPGHKLLAVQRPKSLRGGNLAEATVVGEKVVFTAVFHDLERYENPGFLGVPLGCFSDASLESTRRDW